MGERGGGQGTWKGGGEVREGGPPWLKGGVGGLGRGASGGEGSGEQ
jgi:hypothetical protein